MRRSASPVRSQSDSDFVRVALLDWYDFAHRDLPWRRTSDPYHIWVSEVMLQQTRADVVGPYYQRFVATYPTLVALAGAELDDVLALWSGLGYYRRARALHSAAAECRERYGGEVPRDERRFAALHGVGPYTTAAVLSIAYGVPLAAVDGNVVRVLARLDTLAGDTRSTSLLRAVRSRSSALLDRDRPGDFNQALMELGATICTPRTPRCGECPLRSACRAVATGHPERWPRPATRIATRDVVWAAAVVERRNRVLFARRPGHGRLSDMWELPWSETEPSQIGRHYALDLQVSHPITSVRHSILNERITVYAHRAKLVGRVPARGFRWISASELGSIATSSVWRKVLRAIDQRAMMEP